MDGISSLIIAICAVLLTGIGTASAISTRTMSKDDCKKERDQCGQHNTTKMEHIHQSIEELKYATEIQQGMLVAIVQNLPRLSSEEKTEIINYRPRKKP